MRARESLPAGARRPVSFVDFAHLRSEHKSFARGADKVVGSVKRGVLAEAAEDDAHERFVFVVRQVCGDGIARGLRGLFRGAGAGGAGL